MIDTQLLSKICEVPGAPGFEQRVREMVISTVEPLVDKWYTDSLGNVIALKKGQSSEKRMMVAAHMDEISFIVTHIDDDGFIRFHTLGGFDPKTLVSQRVIVHGSEDLLGVMGSKPIHLMSEDERKRLPKVEDFFVDLGMGVEEVKKIVSIGDTITRERQLIEMGNCVNSKSLDNRVSVYILIEALREMQDTALPYDFYAVFTVQEEVGLRGAMLAAHHINPDFGLALDVTIAFDIPGANSHESITKLGAGAAIKVMDGMTICDYRMVQYLKDMAKEHDINWQPEILPRGGTDTAGLQRYGKNGSIAGAISIPTRNLHQVIEMADKSDIRACINLLKVALNNMNKPSWEF